MEELKSYAEEFAKRQTKFLFERLSVFKCEYVGFKILLTLPKTDSKWHELTFKGEYSYSFLGVDDKKDLEKYINDGYTMFIKKDLDKLGKMVN